MGESMKLGLAMTNVGRGMPMFMWHNFSVYSPTFTPCHAK